VIYVKRGVYAETVEVRKKKWNVMLVGDGMGATVITGRLNYVDGYSTFRTATVGECTRPTKVHHTLVSSPLIRESNKFTYTASLRVHVIISS
jgi:pectin methylesterase-like acyl-CoA thioesterase